MGEKFLEEHGEVVNQVKADPGTVSYTHLHDTLAYINEMMDLEGLELHQDGESYPCLLYTSRCV